MYKKQPQNSKIFKYVVSHKNRFIGVFKIISYPRGFIPVHD